MKKPAGSRFAWDDGDIVPLKMGECLSEEPHPHNVSRAPIPDWPRSPLDWDRITAVASWVEDLLPEATERWGDDIIADSNDKLRESSGSGLKASERKALLESFDGKGATRWGPVVEILKAGTASHRLQVVLAAIIEANGLFPGAEIPSYESLVIFREQRVIQKILAEHFPHQTDKAVTNLARDLAAILLRAATDEADEVVRDRQLGDVRSAIKLRKDPRRQALAAIRWRVSTDPRASD